MAIEPVLTLGAYLKEQAAVQQRRPSTARQRVPTYKELGRLLKVDPMTVYRLTTTSYRGQLPLNLAYRVMTEVRRLGFEIGVSDLVTWELPTGILRPPTGWQAGVNVKTSRQVAVILGRCLAVCRGIGAPPVPHITELAAVAQMSRRQLERILADDGQRLDLTKLGRLLTALAQAGWGLLPEDVLYYPEPDGTPVP